MSYAYWNAPFGPSPKPVVLRISRGRYAMVPELMPAQGPTAAESWRQPVTSSDHRCGLVFRDGDGTDF